MTTLLMAFVVSLASSLLFTPLVRDFGCKVGALDVPDQKRKLHSHPIPRIGGVAIALAFLATLCVVVFSGTTVSKLFVLDRRSIFLGIGAVIAFSIGLVDDFRRITPKIKLFFQILSASIAFWGGIRIEAFHVDGLSMEFGTLITYSLTVFWFLLFINAVNLIDGLDGLAGGLTFFTSLMMLILSVMQANYEVSIFFAALSGSILGFLRYNFNPASIFLGDSGSYFLGYMLAALAITGSIKSRVSVVMLMPLLALGVPVFDTFIAPIRRFVLGKGIFQADRGHIHHKLIRLGFSTKKVVYILYGITFLFCILALILVNVRDESIGFFLVVIALVLGFIVRKIGYFEYLTSEKLLGWLHDITDVVGLTKERRSFLNLQIDLSQANTVDDLWERTTRILHFIGMDTAELYWEPAECQKIYEETKDSLTINHHWTWDRDELIRADSAHSFSILQINLPLLDEDSRPFGMLRLSKNLQKDDVDFYTFRRIEYLRKGFTQTFLKLQTRIIQPHLSSIPILSTPQSIQSSIEN